MNEKTCCFSGHRKISAENFDFIKRELRKNIIQSINKGYKYFVTGGAIGFDTFAAEAVIDIRKKFPYIELILILPCVSQTRGWKQEDKEVYEKIKMQANKVYYVSENYTYDCMHKRNRKLVECSSLCICYLTDNKGGTAYTVNYAKQNSLDIINIYGKKIKVAFFRKCVIIITAIL